MTVAMGRKASGDLRAGQSEIPRVAGGHGWWPGVKRGASVGWRPAIDIAERTAAYVVTVEIPGIRADEVAITMKDGLLTIQGERHAARGAAGDKIHRSERGHGVFRRSVTLPSSHVNAGKTEASARDGVLEIVVPKAPEAQVGLIRIRVSRANATLAPTHTDEGK
ncbi:MAG TPA: Hsp20/alpha crystallin family protein [Trebonia sp.]|jgi:HSP20 family molecular chaperone IbpA|nr:Hsp20/alpha crystallin family protein [Trebonia sp.]